MGTNNRPPVLADVPLKKPLPDFREGYPHAFRRSVPKQWEEASEVERFITHLRPIADCCGNIGCVERNDHGLRLLSYAELIQWSICVKKWTRDQWRFVWREKSDAFKHRFPRPRPWLGDEWTQEDYIGALKHSNDFQLDPCAIYLFRVGEPPPIFKPEVFPGFDLQPPPYYAGYFPPYSPPPPSTGYPAAFEILVNDDQPEFITTHGSPLSEAIMLPWPFDSDDLKLQVTPRTTDLGVTPVGEIVYQISKTADFLPFATLQASQLFPTGLQWTFYGQKSPPFFWPQIPPTELEAGTTYYLRWKVIDVFSRETEWSSRLVVLVTGPSSSGPSNSPPTASSIFASSTAMGLGGPPFLTGPFAPSGTVWISVLYSDLDGDVGDRYQLQFGDYPAFSSISYDSGDLALPSVVASGGRTVNVPAAPFLVGTHGVRMRVRDAVGNWSNFASSSIEFA